MALFDTLFDNIDSLLGSTFQTDPAGGSAAGGPPMPAAPAPAPAAPPAPVPPTNSPTMPTGAGVPMPQPRPSIADTIGGNTGYDVPIGDQPPPQVPTAPVGNAPVGAPPLPPAQPITSAPIAPPAPPPAPPPPPGNLDPGYLQGRTGAYLSGQPYTGGAGPWMSGVFGDPRRSNQMAASLGAGLKSVASNWNKPGLAAFAGSAGAAIEGGAAGDSKWLKEEGNAIDRLQKAVDSRNASEIAAARVDYWNKKLQATERAGTMGGRTGAWQNSEAGRFSMAEQRINNSVEGYRKTLDDDLKGNSGPKKQQEAQDKIDKFRDQERERIYKGFGLDPSKYQSYKDRGTAAYAGEGDKRKLDIDATKQRAFTPRTWDEFNATVKPGDYFINPKDDGLYQRKHSAPTPADAPGGLNSQPSPIPPPSTAARQQAGGEPLEPDEANEDFAEG